MSTPHPKPRYNKGFFWTALVLLFIGGTMALLLSVDRTNISARLAARATILLTGSAMALCLICGTADWWLKR